MSDPKYNGALYKRVEAFTARPVKIASLLLAQIRGDRPNSELLDELIFSKAIELQNKGELSAEAEKLLESWQTLIQIETDTHGDENQ